MTKEQYAQFLKAYKKARYVEIAFRSTTQLDLQSWSAPAIATVKLSWTDDGVHCEYKADFDARMTYAMGDIETIGHLGYTSNFAAGYLSYLFQGLCKDGDIFFRCEISDTLSKTTTKIELSANVGAGKQYYSCVPIETLVTVHAWALHKGARQTVDA